MNKKDWEVSDEYLIEDFVSSIQGTELEYKVKEAKRFIKDLIRQKQKEAYVKGYKEAVQGLKSVRERKPIEEIDLDKASVKELKDIKQQLIERIEDE